MAIFNNVQNSCEYLHKNSRVNIKGSSLRTMKSLGVIGFALVALPFLAQAIFYNDLLSAYSISTGTLQAASLNPIIAGLFEMQAIDTTNSISICNPRGTHMGLFNTP